MMWKTQKRRLRHIFAFPTNMPEPLEALARSMWTVNKLSQGKQNTAGHPLKHSPLHPTSCLFNLVKLEKLRGVAAASEKPCPACNLEQKRPFSHSQKQADLNWHSEELQSLLAKERLVTDPATLDSPSTVPLKIIPKGKGVGGAQNTTKWTQQKKIWRCY